MGIILSTVRKKKSAVESLEKLENDIREIEESKSNAQMRYKKITKSFILISIMLYLLCGIIIYFQYTSTLQNKLLYLVPLALSPLLLYLLKRIISWYYKRLIDSNQLRLNEMKKEKKKILDEVMDKETYKVAKEILEKYSTENAPKFSQMMQMTTFKRPDEGIRKRLVSVPSAPRPQPSSMVRNIAVGPTVNSSPQTSRSVPGTPIMRFPAPVLPLERSYVDKVVEYLIGDGPNNRYALICSKCHSHNGMALKEEFEYIGFKCCYCYFYNPARKIRPEAPKLEGLLKGYRESDSDSDLKTSEDNSEEEARNLGKNFSQSADEVRLKTPEPNESHDDVHDSHEDPRTSADDEVIYLENPEQTNSNKAGNSEIKETKEKNCDEALTRS